MDEGVRDERREIEEDASEDLEVTQEDAEQVSGGTKAWPSKLHGAETDMSNPKK